MIDRAAIRARYDAVSPHLDEEGLRLFAASEARAAGRGGIAAVFGRGLKELASNDVAPPQERIRRTGGGRKQATSQGLRP